jgi:MFS family permease
MRADGHEPGPFGMLKMIFPARRDCLPDVGGLLALPTPLYDIYQAQWHFSAAIVTVTFAVYAAGVLLTLLLTGRASDQAGRKPVLAAALGCSALSTVVFILAPNVGVLMIGRILSGFSAGLMTGTATAALTELVPASASRRASLVATAVNMGGLGLGPLIAGLFAQYGPHPTPGPAVTSRCAMLWPAWETRQRSGSASSIWPGAALSL